MKIGFFTLNWRRLGVIIGIGVVLVLVMNFNARLGDLAHLQNQAATIAAQATGVMVTHAVLLTQEAFATSSDAVDQYAHGEAHMARPGDHVVIVLPAPGSTPQPTPIPTPVVNNLSAWDVWMSFIFGK